MLVKWYTRQAVLFISWLLGKQEFIINSTCSFVALVYKNSLSVQFVPHCVRGDLRWSKQKWKISIPLSDFPGTLKLKNEVQYFFQHKVTMASLLYDLGNDIYKTTGNHPAFQTTYSQGWSFKI